MREIKFRAWTAGHWIEDCTEKTMYYNFQDCLHWEFYEEVELMQFTGLKDKNGKDIYESDIVRVVIGDKVSTFAVYYNEKLARFELRNNPKSDVMRVTKIRNPEYSIEVIGNIHENPDLL